MSLGTGLHSPSSGENGLRQIGLILVVAWLVVLVLCVPALADETATQSPMPAPSPTQTASKPYRGGGFALSVGAAFARSSNAAPTSGNTTQYLLGFEYSFANGSGGQPFTYLDLRSNVSISVGAFGFGYSSESLASNRAYAGIGLGYSYTNLASSSCPFCSPSLSPPCIDFCGSSGGAVSGLGGKIFLGLPIASGFGFEASYDVSPSVNGVSSDTVDVRLKYRFR